MTSHCHFLSIHIRHLNGNLGACSPAHLLFDYEFKSFTCWASVMIMPGSPLWYTKLVLTTRLLLDSHCPKTTYLTSSAHRFLSLSLSWYEWRRVEEVVCLEGKGGAVSCQEIHKTLWFSLAHALARSPPADLPTSWGKCALDSPNVSCDFVTRWANCIVLPQTSGRAVHLTGISEWSES